MIYEDAIESTSSVKNWKYGSIIFWVLTSSLFSVWFKPLSGINVNSMIMFAIFLFFTLINICLLCVSGLKYAYAANLVTLVIIVHYSIGTVLFQWYAVGLPILFLGFGLSAIYAVKVRKDNNKSDDSKQNKDTPGDISEKSVIENQSEITPKSVEIQMVDVHNCTMWDNIDRQRSIDSTGESSEQELSTGDLPKKLIRTDFVC